MLLFLSYGEVYYSLVLEVYMYLVVLLSPKHSLCLNLFDKEST